MYGGLRDQKWTPMEADIAGALAPRLLPHHRRRHQRGATQHHRQPGVGVAARVGMRLPNAENARVEPTKITNYLLSLDSERGRSKAKFFMEFGFTQEEWQRLAEGSAGPRGQPRSHQSY